MDADFFKAVMGDVQDANKSGMDFRGKKYTVVSSRVEILRRHFGGSVGIETEIVNLGTARGEPVVMRAIVRDRDGFVIGTGTAWEIVGEGHVNKTSALENAETSAIGRALAAMGIHGGEYASANELRDKEPNPTSKSLRQAIRDSVSDRLPDDPSPETFYEALADTLREKALSYKSSDGVKRFFSSWETDLVGMQEHAPEAYEALKSEAANHMQKLNERKAA